MIKPQDIEFHVPPSADHTWAETNYFCLTIPDARLMASVYTVTRKALGVQLVDVAIFGALTDRRAEGLYLDSQQHLPAPARLSNYRTPNGLHVQAFDLRNYRIDYVGHDVLARVNPAARPGLTRSAAGGRFLSNCLRV